MEIYAWTAVVNIIGIGFCLWTFTNRPEGGLRVIIWILLVVQVAMLVLNLMALIT